MQETFKARIQKKFNIRIPVVVRGLLNLKEGDVVEIKITDSLEVEH